MKMRLGGFGLVVFLAFTAPLRRQAAVENSTFAGDYTEPVTLLAPVRPIAEPAMENSPPPKEGERGP